MEYQQLVYNSSPINVSSITDTSSLDYKNQLNLALTINQAESQIADQITLLQSKVILQPNTFRALNLTIESYLYILLTISTTTTLDNTQSSSYYGRRRLVDPNIYEAVDSTYLQDLTFTNYKPWCSKPGSLGYYLPLSQSNLHYANPSTLIRNSVTTAINSLPSASFTNSILNLIASDDTATDIGLYNISFSIFNELALLKTAGVLTFLETWIPSLLNWYYPVATNNTGNPYSKGTTSYTAYNFLIGIGQQVLQLGLFNGIAANLQYNFYHQSIDLIVLDSITTIINYRKLNDFSITDATLTTEETLCNQLFQGISILTTSTLCTDESYNLLLNFPYKGGVNFWLVLVASELLNRAYILSHPSITPYSTNTIYPITNDPSYLSLLTRVYQLIFYSGYCLKKTNLDSLNILGSNLRTLSQLDTDTYLQEFNLLA